MELSKEFKRRDVNNLTTKEIDRIVSYAWDCGVSSCDYPTWETLQRVLHVADGTGLDAGNFRADLPDLCPHLESEKDLKTPYEMHEVAEMRLALTRVYAGYMLGFMRGIQAAKRQHLYAAVRAAEETENSAN